MTLDQSQRNAWCAKGHPGARGFPEFAAHAMQTINELIKAVGGLSRRVEALEQSYVSSSPQMQSLGSPTPLAQ